MSESKLVATEETSPETIDKHFGDIVTHGGVLIGGIRIIIELDPVDAEPTLNVAYSNMNGLTWDEVFHALTRVAEATLAVMDDIKFREE